MLRAFCACLGIGVSVAVILALPGPCYAQAQPEAAGIAQPQPAATVPARAVTPKTDAQLDAELKERDERATLTDQLVLYGALLVAVGAFLAIAFAVQAFYLGLGLRAMRRAAESAERNTTAAQRAFVYTSALNWSAAGANLKISPIWVNSGTTPARRLRISTNWKASHSELQPTFEANYTRAPENLFLGPAGKAEIGTLLIPMRDVQAAIEDRLHLYVWGRATYDDMFEGTAPHFFEFCHRVEVSGAAPAQLGVAFTQFGLNNGSDQDARVPDAPV
jgi:hypothetical protein